MQKSTNRNYDLPDKYDHSFSTVNGQIHFAVIYQAMYMYHQRSTGITRQQIDDPDRYQQLIDYCYTNYQPINS